MSLSESEVGSRINFIKSQLPPGVKLVAITKNQPVSKILDAFNSGHNIFGENRVQELTQKYNSLPKTIQWHLVGHLQTNKVKNIVGFVDMIHSVDSIKLCHEINRHAAAINRKINCLLQFYIATEETKFGLFIEESELIIHDYLKGSWPFIQICGVMGMASFSQNHQLVRNEFKNLFQIFKRLKHDFFAEKPEFCEISMGMSSDYKIAIDEGATIVRIGNLIFGER